MSSHARFVAAGVLASRLAGLARTKVLNHYFGVSGLLDVWTSVFRVPNLLQNLLGDQAMAAAFIPIYSRLLADGKREEAGRFAGAVLGLLIAVVSLIVLLAVVAAPVLVAVFSPGYLADAARVAAGEQALDRYPLAVVAARIVFPMAGLLVLSAWAQGILNSHRRFFLPYVAPVLWNAAIIGTLVFYAWHRRIAPASADLETLGRLLVAGTVGAAAGGLLQFLVQVPLVIRLTRGLRPALDARSKPVRRMLRAFGPALAGRGVAQVSFYLDTVISSLLRTGAQGAMLNGIIFYNLPFAVFATSVAASELPELSSPDLETENTEDKERFVTRLRQSLRQILFLVMPSTVGYLAFGFLVVGLLRGGRFGVADHSLVWLVLAAYTLGMPASASSRLLQNAFFALGNTATPARIAAIRVGVSALIGIALAIVLDRFPLSSLGVEDAGPEPLFLGAVGLALGGAFGAWIEIVLLLRAIARTLGARLRVLRLASPLLLTSVLTAIPSLALWWWVRDTGLWIQVAAVPGLYALVYLGLAYVRRSPELGRWLGRRG